MLAARLGCLAEAGVRGTLPCRPGAANGNPPGGGDLKHLRLFPGRARALEVGSSFGVVTGTRPGRRARHRRHRLPTATWFSHQGRYDFGERHGGEIT